jgi:hypothetical protein
MGMRGRVSQVRRHGLPEARDRFNQGQSVVDDLACFHLHRVDNLLQMARSSSNEGDDSPSWEATDVENYR